MQQSATEKERGRSGQFNKRKYIPIMAILNKLVKLQNSLFPKFKIFVQAFVADEYMAYTFAEFHTIHII